MKQNLPRSLITKKYFEKFKSGKEKGLEYFYELFYPPLSSRSKSYVKDCTIASSITQEAFLRLWLLRTSIRDIDHLKDFLSKQIKEAGAAYYRKTNTRFHRSLLQLDGIENFQEFMLGYEMEEEVEEDTVYLEELESTKKDQLNQLQAILPNLTEQQQLFIKLCLKYSFSYDRISWHLGGISDYEVSLHVEKTIETLKAALCGTNKLDELSSKPKKIICEGELSDEQAEVLKMRYELQYSFEEIADALKLKNNQVKKIFVQAHAVVRKAKKSA
jgi:RNA polymerase sigma factor (sigma-70 family)